MKFQFTELIDVNKQPKNFLTHESSFNKQDEEEVVVTIEAIHAMTTKNYTTYTASALKGSTYSWTSPYPKPVLTHHNSYNGEPVGRVIEAEFKENSLAGPPVHLLTVKITDPDAVQKVNDGRYQTVSVGGSAEHAYCSVCGKDWVEKGWCEHRPGEEYGEGENRQTMHLILENLSFKEVSFVNVPADQYAQIIKQQSENDESALMVESFILSESRDKVNKPLNNIKSNNKEQPQIEGESNKGGSQMDLEEKITTLEEKLTTKEERVSVLEDKNESLEADNASLQEKLDTSEEKVDTLNNKIELQEKEIEKLTKENEELKENQHRYLAEKVVEMKVEMGKVAEENYDEVLEDHVERTEESLKDTLKDLETEKELSESSEMGEQIEDPGLKEKEDGVEIDGDTTTSDRVKKYL